MDDIDGGRQMNNSKSSAPQVHVLETSSVFLPDSGETRRLPRQPQKNRPPSFYERFEDRALFYDCFAASDDKIVLIGPPPLNLDHTLRSAQFRALPSGTSLKPSWFASRSTMVTVLGDAPAGTEMIELTFEGFTETFQVQPDRSNLFADRRVMFTMNKDNDLEWIELWARWHSEAHGVDAIIIFDNGSSRYGVSEIADALSGVSGLKAIGLVSWPFRYGPIDPAVLTHPYWANFLQVASFSAMLRNFGRRSSGILNCDVDELVGTDGDKDVFSILSESRDGYVKLKGTWIEAVRSNSAEELAGHFSFEHRSRNPLRARCADKWALDPARDWLQDFNVFPMMHRIYGQPRIRALAAPTLPFWHFRGINTNWKEARALPVLPSPDHRHVKDVAWQAARQRFLRGSKAVSA